MLLSGKSKSGETLLSRNMVEFMKINRIPNAQLPLMLGPLPLAGYGWNLIGRTMLDRGQMMSQTGEMNLVGLELLQHISGLILMKTLLVLL